MVFAISSVLGPLVGGAFTGQITWRWCFYINLPIGGVTLVVMYLLLHLPSRPQKPASLKEKLLRLDPFGSLFLVPAIVSLLLALEWGGSTYAWSDARVVALLVLFVVLIAIFAVVEIKNPERATVPPKIISQRSIFLGALYSFFLSMSMLICVYFLPLWFQSVRRADPVRSGIYTIPLVLSLVVSSIGGGAMTTKIGYYVPSMLIAPSIMSIGEGLMTTFSPNSGQAQWIGFQFLTGFGLGFGMQTANLAAQTVLSKDDVSIGVAIMMFTQMLGGAVGTSIGQVIFSNLLISKLQGVSDLDPATIINSGATELVALVADRNPKLLGLVLDAYNFACTRTFFAALGSAFCALVAAVFMEWRTIKKGKQQPVGPRQGNAMSADSLEEQPLGEAEKARER